MGNSKKRRGRPQSAAIWRRAGEIVDDYVILKALAPEAKHKEELLPLLARMHGLSSSRVDKILKKLAPVPKRRQWVQVTAQVHAWLHSPAGLAWLESPAGSTAREMIYETWGSKPGGKR